MTIRPAGIFGQAAIGLSLLAVGSAGCSGGADPTIQPLVLGLKERVRPEGGTVSDFSGLRHDENGVHASWEIDTGMDWTAYSAWVKGRIPADFAAASDDDSSLSFRKPMEADVYVLQIRPLSSGSPARVRVTFDGYPH